MLSGEIFPSQNDLNWCIDTDTNSGFNATDENNEKSRNHLRIFFDQLKHWTKAGFSMVRADKNGLFCFIILALLCTWAIQIGVQVGENRKPEIMLVTLLALAAPWLCATYSAIFSANLMHFYAWENFSGLKAASYVLGLFTSLTAPAAVLALIFSMGLYLVFPMYKAILPLSKGYRTATTDSQVTTP
jgi:hypothetical protein